MVTDQVTVYSRWAKIVLFECCDDFGVGCIYLSNTKNSITYILRGHPVNVANARRLFFKNLSNRKKF